MRVFIQAKHIREGDSFKGYEVTKATPVYHGVLLWLDDRVDPYHLGDQDWIHVERDDR